MPLLELEEISTMTASYTGRFGRACWELVMLLLKVPPGFVLYISPGERQRSKWFTRVERSARQGFIYPVFAVCIGFTACFMWCIGT